MARTKSDSLTPHVMVMPSVLPTAVRSSVDDDPLLLKSMQDILEADGHAIEVADSGQAGIDKFVAAHRAIRSRS